MLNARRGNLLASSTLARETCHSQWSETTEAICLQATLVFLGLLRYARNDKSQDRHEAKTLSP